MNNNETNIVTRTAKGTPVTDTIQVARIFRNGKTNNVYRMAKRLAGMPAYKSAREVPTRWCSTST